MHLIELSVYKNNDLVRKVPFKKGLNLIVNSISGNANTGNSVGKSTPSRLLDYLFLSSGKDIYTEPEFDKFIPEVYDYIVKNEILVELIFEGYDAKKYQIG